MSSGAEGLVELAAEDGFDAVTGRHDAVLLDFYTPSCVICRRLEPMLATVAAEMGDRIAVLKVNAEAHVDTAVRCDVRGVPSLVLVREGEVVDRKVGFVSARELRQWLQQRLA